MNEQDSRLHTAPGGTPVELPRKGMLTRVRDMLGVIPLFVMAHFGHHVLTALPVPLLALIRSDFQLDYTQAGLVTSAFSLCYGFAQMPAGWLSDRIHPRILVTIGVCGVAVAGFFVGLSHTFMMMIIFLGLMGIAGGGYHPAASTLIASSIEPKNRARALGFHTIGGGLSYFLAPLLAVAISSAWGWRAAFVYIAFPTMALGIIFYVIMLARAARDKGRQARAATGETTFMTGRVRRLVAFTIMSVVAGSTINAVVAFIPLYLVDHFGVAKEAAGAFISIVYSAGLWAGPIGGALADRFGRVTLILAACGLTVLVIFFLPLAPFGPAIWILLVLLGIIIYVRMPVSEGFVIDNSPVNRRSTILGIYFFTSQEAGGIVTPALGALIDRFSFQTSLTYAAGVILVVTIITSFFLRPGKVVEKQTTA